MIPTIYMIIMFCVMHWYMCIYCNDWLNGRFSIFFLCARPLNQSAQLKRREKWGQFPTDTRTKMPTDMHFRTVICVVSCTNYRENANGDSFRFEFLLKHLDCFKCCNWLVNYTCVFFIFSGLSTSSAFQLTYIYIHIYIFIQRFTLFPINQMHRVSAAHPGPDSGTFSKLL